MGTKINEVMTDRPRAVTPQTSVREAARLMEEEDVGSLPVVEEGVRLIGIVTDRDVAVRVVAGGLDPDSTPVSEVASLIRLAISAAEDAIDVFSAATSASMSAAVAAMVASSLMILPSVVVMVFTDAASPLRTARSALVNPSGQKLTAPAARRCTRRR